MAFLDELKDKAGELWDKGMDLAQTGVAKSKQLAEIARLNVAIASEEENLKKVYVEIGKLYYAERGMAPDPAYAALCEKVTASKTTVEEYRTRIAELKTQGPEKEPEECGVETDVAPEEPDCCGCDAPAEPETPEEPKDEE